MRGKKEICPCGKMVSEHSSFFVNKEKVKGGTMRYYQRRECGNMYVIFEVDNKDLLIKK